VLVLLSRRARIVTAFYDCNERLWEAASGKEITRINPGRLGYRAQRVRGKIALGAALGRVHVFEAADFLSTGVRSMVDA
jgi:hypothetical protein